MPTDTAGLSDEQRSRDIAAGDAFRKTLLPRADATQGGAPMFYGWAIMEAYLAGLRDGREDFSEARPLAKAEHKLLVQLAFIVNKLVLKGLNHEAYTPEIVQAFGLDFVQTMRECGIEP